MMSIVYILLIFLMMIASFMVSNHKRNRVSRTYREIVELDLVSNERRVVGDIHYQKATTILRELNSEKY